MPFYSPYKWIDKILKTGEDPRYSNWKFSAPKSSLLQEVRNNGYNNHPDWASYLLAEHTENLSTKQKALLHGVYDEFFFLRDMDKNDFVKRAEALANTHSPKIGSEKKPFTELETNVIRDADEYKPTQKIKFIAEQIGEEYNKVFRAYYNLYSRIKRQAAAKPLNPKNFKPLTGFEERILAADTEYKKSTPGGRNAYLAAKYSITPKTVLNIFQRFNSLILQRKKNKIPPEKKAVEIKPPEERLKQADILLRQHKEYRINGREVLMTYLKAAHKLNETAARKLIRSPKFETIFQPRLPKY